MENKINFKVGGLEISVITEDSEQNAKQVSDRVTKCVEEILGDNPRITVAYAAVLAAMQFCNEQFKTQEDMEHLRSQITSYIDETQRAYDETAEAKRQMESLRREIDNLRSRLNG